MTMKITDLDWKKQAAILSCANTKAYGGYTYAPFPINPALIADRQLTTQIWPLLVYVNNNQLEALRNNPDTIIYIRNPSQDAIEFIIANAPSNIRFIPELTVEQQMRVVTQDVTLYLLINNPCDEVVEHANEHLTRALNQHPEIFAWDRFGCRNK